MNPLLIFVLNHFVKFKFLDGYKMYGVGAGMVFAGLGTLAHAVATGDYTINDSIIHAFELIGGGIGVIGAAGKADGLIAATKENTAVALVNADANRATAVNAVGTVGIAEQTGVTAMKVATTTTEIPS